MFFGTAHQFFNRWQARQDFLAAFTQTRIQLAGEQLCQMIIQRADVFGNRHLIVVEDNQHVRFDVACVVHRFKRHTCGDRAIANYTNGTTTFTFTFSSHRHAEACADGGR
ncbi:hypothetical protein SRABI106_01168 [Rahnella aquatilis]|nr:hypothetical protein SRABI106_01168 [Rahnella aquatilis]